ADVEPGGAALRGVGAIEIVVDAQRAQDAILERACLASVPLADRERKRRKAGARRHRLHLRRAADDDRRHHEAQGGDDETCGHAAASAGAPGSTFWMLNSIRNATAKSSQPENVWKNPSAAPAPKNCAARPVPATRSPLATTATGMAASASAIRANSGDSETAP